MSLGIRTFDNRSRSGDPLFKAIGHPAISRRIPQWIAGIACMGRVAVVDPWAQFSSLAALYDISALDIERRYVQRIEDLGNESLEGPKVASLLELSGSKADVILLATFDSDHARRAILPILPRDIPIVSFDEIRIEDTYLTNRRRYLDPLNFCTNFALFRAGKGRHSVVRSAEYWTGYGANKPRLSMILFDGDGSRLAAWDEVLAARQGIALDAHEVRRRFDLAPFEGMLFIHAVGIAGHDTMKYVLDDLSDDLRDPAVTHDSNSWPAEYYSGLPAPAPGETVRLWLQNSHPGPVPAGAIRIGKMGDATTVPIETSIPGFGSVAVDLVTLLPGVAWPAQVEAATGNHVIRPRYEILRGDNVTFAHMNVERTDLRPEPEILRASGYLGKGYLLPAPIFPLGQWRNLALPTPAARGQMQLPLGIVVYHADGQEVLQRPLGLHDRARMPEIDINALLAQHGITDEAFEGHFELIYDFAHNVDVDGWLHALFRYHDKAGGQMGDTSFGAHVFNLPLTFRDEPQSYAGKPPGLSSRLFARLMPAPLQAFVHLTYPSSGTWRSASDTTVVLHAASGEPLGEARVSIPLNGSRTLYASALFEAALLDQAGSTGYMIFADRTCRLFGYHGVTGPHGAFALDHMFGF